MSTPERPRSIVVGVDGSTGSIDALRTAQRLATALNASVDVVGCWEWPAMFDPTNSPDWHPEADARELARETITAVYGDADAVPLRISSGPTARSLIEASSGAEMLVVGSRGRGGFAGLLLGSVSATCAEHAHCPVLVVHPVRPDDLAE
jgi:nucleotide-binding universal stress UspA family protein